ncbi:Bug family tripartite tricarboxylate transporter substrate binding protein [Hydrogenophaga intermedia]|uniref:Bug family tripartite tricarboxylate transporter substrate binding protein n=1 Tax=Hydrogenophaga intermedia TaxID=65786 RepID=UPI00204358FD|nr:tripartite tricarboxylate transporter substrate binding protein [Hydrogenophaga intermedia]MCM3562836.1 tripartite tricarboxylate transporter substrate binding protein [Hydrogenophaga intermedia]
MIRLFLSFLLLLPLMSLAQTWPDRPVKLVTNFAPGSAPDVLARTVGRFLSEELRQPVVVENRVGAAGNVGVEYVVRAAPDGYTLLYSPGSTITMNPHLYQFDLQKELVPVAAVNLSALPLVVRADLPIHSVKDLIAYAKQNPGKLTYGSSGAGSPLHVAAELLLSGAGIKAVHVPYKGSAQTTNALLAKEIDFAFDAGVASPHVKAGKLRYLALASSARSPSYPGVPTVEEAAGFPVEVSVPGGIFAPPGTPPELVARLNQMIGRIMANPAFRDAISVINSAPPPTHLSPSELAASFRSYTDRFGAAIRAANIPRQ